MLEFIDKSGINYEEIKQKHLTPGFIKIPFTSARKRQSTVCMNVENGTELKQRLHIKGASELILESCSYLHSFQTNQIIPITPEIRSILNDIIFSIIHKYTIQ